MRAAEALTVAGVAGAAGTAHRSRLGAALSGAALLAASACARFGIFEAEARFGVLLTTGDERALPTRILGEWHVRAVLGRVPAATDFLRHLKGQRWMAAAQSSRRLGLG